VNCALISVHVKLFRIKPSQIQETVSICDFKISTKSFTKNFNALQNNVSALKITKIGNGVFLAA
jgi:hypothetical protein